MNRARVSLTILSFVACLIGFGFAQSSKTVRIAAAADLQPALEEISRQYTQSHPGIAIQTTFGSSGKLAQQILEGAPFDVFFSADESFALRLENAGKLEAGTRKLYAVGRLVVWVPNRLGLDVGKLGLKVLNEPSIKRIAIANPEVAPYGKAAISLLENGGLLETLKPKLIYGENVAQAAQFALTAADAGIIGLATAKTETMSKNGSYWLAPLESHKRLNQTFGIVTGGNRPEVRSFVKSLSSKDSRAILERYGFLIP
jgi:molybdate transport system substrate-binding protein